MSRRVTYALLAAVLLGSGAAVVAQSRATATNVAVIPHEAVRTSRTARHLHRREHGIATNSKGNIYIYHRANETRLFEFAAGRSSEIGRHITACLAHWCGLTRRQHSRSTKAPTC